MLCSRSLHSSPRVATLRVVGLALTTWALLTAPIAGAATPSAGSLSNSTPSLTWAAGAIAGATVNESTCQEGVSCETFTLTLEPGDYTGKRITIGINWIVPTDDIDLYVHANTVSGSVVTASTGSPPGTGELTSIPIDPPVVTTALVYVAHVVCSAAAAGATYSGHAELSPVPAPRTATYLAGTLRFSQNVALKAPVTVSDGEPSIRVDVRGNCYVSGIRGVPAGVDLWRIDLNPTSPTFDPGMQSPTYLGQPDAFVPQDPSDPTTGGADGGGDIDIAASFPADAISTPVLTMASLAAAEVSSAVSTDRGQTFTLSPAVAAVPVDDRQWLEADGPNTVYLLYRAPSPGTGLFAQRSDDHGLTYPVTSMVNPSGTTPGYIDVDHANHRVYASHMGTDLEVASSSDNGLTWKNNTVDNTTTHGAPPFDVVKVGDDGTVYCVWSDKKDIYLAHSTDGGVIWSDKVRVNGPTWKTNLMPWLECGSAGRVDVVWYGTTHGSNDDGADWQVVFSQTTDATASSPIFHEQVISDHVIHGSNISLGGLTGAANRNLIDYFQVALDPQGAAVIAFTDDHNDFTGHTYVTRQLDGTSANAAANGDGMVTPAFPPPLPSPDPSQPEVMDYLHDATGALLQPIPEDSPFDILSIDYSCEDNVEPMLVCAMKVSSLAAVPRGANWRMNFTANAPGGLSDRGDQFWVMATTDTADVGVDPLFRFGTAVRASNGSITYTIRGDADYGFFDQPNNQVILKIALSKLNPFVTHGPPIAPGSVLDGLRGSTFTTTVCTPDDLPLYQCRGAVRDQTRGGSSFTYPGCGPTATMLSMFFADGVEDGIRITWRFGTSASIAAVAIERGETEQGPWKKLDPTIEAQGDASFVTDRAAEAGRVYFYRLIVTDSAGEAHRFGPVSGIRGVDRSAPYVSFLRAPSPNPSAGRSSVQFQVGKPGFIELSVFDLTGRRVRSIQAGNLRPGLYTREWDGQTDHFQAAPDGVYFFVLNTADGRLTQRVALAH